MGSQGNPQSWVPFDYNARDCSQGFCSLYCPQWCYFMIPPPPPMGFDDEDSKTNFSPLVIAIIGTLASAFLLVTYYTVISKYCGSLESLLRIGRGSNAHREGSNENQNPPNQETWQNSATGLDEALIRSITVCKYKKGDGFVQVTDCSVCLSEFQEGESVRLLPKCGHAFHLPCIDTWLKSHSNCPLCRANVVSSAATLPVRVVLPIDQQSATDTTTTTPSQQNQLTNNHSSVAVDELERSCEEASEASDASDASDAADAKTPTRNGSHEDIIIEIREERVLPIRRSISMDASHQAHVSVADILSLSEDEDEVDDYHELQNRPYQVGVESSSSKLQLGNHSRADNSRALHSVVNPTAMKRSFSSGRLLFSRNKRGRNITIPM
ncbi:hypothetical protein Sjap_010372 [Stephania japonica]|uniref:RING-type E3 ubiquitin transferase n=1 Tax=Stephania japonica TaxID=461633 RepID=A0AAP0JB29_9MAGN